MLARFATALALAGCASAMPAPSTPAPAAPVVSSARDAALPVVRRPHRMARLSPPFFDSSSVRHVSAGEPDATLASANDRESP